MPKQLIPLTDFRGGWVTDVPPEKMAANTLQVADNVDLSGSGVLRNRPGTVRINETSYEDRVTQIIEWKRDNGDVVDLAVIGKVLCKKESDGSATPIQEVQSDKIGHYIHQDVFFFVDGNDYYWYDGTDCRMVYVVPEAPTVANGTGGNFSGTYKCFYMLRDDAGTWYKSETKTMDVTNKTSLKWVISYVSPEQQTQFEHRLVATAYLYRTASGGNDFKHVDTITPTVTYSQIYRGVDLYYYSIMATYYDAIAESDLGGTPATGASTFTAPTVTGYSDKIFNGFIAASVTFVNKHGIESVHSPFATTEITNAPSIQWTDIPLGDETTTSRRLYRTIIHEYSVDENTDGIELKFVKEIKNNTRTTYIDVITDDDLKEVEGSLPMDNGVNAIRKCKYMARNPKNYRIFANGDGTPKTFFSEPSQPGYFKETNIMVPSTGDGPSMGLSIFIDAIIANFLTMPWAWIGTDPETDAQWKQIPTPNGSVSPWAITSTPNSMTYFGMSGPVAMSPTVISAPSTIQLAQGTQNLAELKIGSVFASLNNKEDSGATFDVKSNIYYLCVNGCLYAYFWPLGSFSKWDGPPVYDILYKSNGEVWLASDNYILKFDRDTLTDAMPDGTDAPISFDARTPDSSLGAPFNRKKLCRLFVSYQYPGTEDYSLTVNVYIDGSLAVTTDIQPTGSAGVRQAIIPVHKDGCQVSVEIVNEDATPTTVFGIALETDFIKEAYGNEV